MRRQVGWILTLSLMVFLAGCGTAKPEIQIRPGSMAPDFTLEDIDGNQVSLSDFAGKPVLINFWASWCPPCRVEMPELQRVYKAQQDSGFAILAVNLLYQDNLDDVYDFFRQTKISFPTLLDEHGTVAATYRVGSLPTSVFVDTGGRIHLIQVGPMTQTFVESVLQEIP